MLKIERKVIEFIEKHMLLLAFLIVSVLALYIRRHVIWWSPEDVSSAFDYHGNHVQSTTYYLLVRMTEYIPMLPLHSIKWIAGLADFGVAGMCVLLLGNLKENTMKKLLCFIACIMSPLVFLRGAAFAQIDSLAMFFMLCALFLWKKKKSVIAILAGILGTGLYPGYLALVVLFFFFDKEDGKNRAWILSGIVIGGSILLQGLCGVALGDTFQAGVFSSLNWTSYNPSTGILFASPVEWLTQMISYFGYAIAIVLGFAAYHKKISYFTAMLGHFGILILYGCQFFLLEIIIG